MGVTHHLDGRLQENLHGWFDAGLEPRVIVEPGDRVIYRTPHAMWDRDAPTPTRRRTGRVSRDRRGAGHALTGPVWIQGAEPGDALAVRILEVFTRDWAVAGHAPGKEGAISGVLGGEPDDVEDDFLIHLTLDRAHGV